MLLENDKDLTFFCVPSDVFFNVVAVFLGVGTQG